MQLLSVELSGPSFRVLDPPAFIVNALSLSEPSHFAVVGYGPLRQWVSGIARTRELPFLDIGMEHPIIAGCRLDFVARDAVRRLLLRGEDDIAKRGVVSIHHWWLYSDDRAFIACWDWQHCGGPVVVDSSLAAWMSSQVDCGVMAEIPAGD